MSEAMRQTWEAYTSSWKAESADAKRELYQQGLDPTCEYNDPNTLTKGFDELIDYMLNFHKMVPGGHFATKYFLAHSNKSIATWDMKDGKGEVIGEGISYGEYNDEGKLVSITGFYEAPSG